MDIYLIIGLIVILVILIIFAFILHNSRVSSTKATDYFNNLDFKKDDKSDIATLEDKSNPAEEKVLESETNGINIREEQTSKYLMLMDMHKNNKYLKGLQESIENIDKDDLSEYLNVSELSELLGMNTEDMISFLIDQGLIERDHYTLVLTDKGVDIGGQYNSHEEVTWIEFSKDILNKLENSTKTIEPKIRDKKSSEDGKIWFIVIVIALIYFLFFK